MSNSDFMQFVLNDVNKYAGNRRLIKANILERLIVRKISPFKLHPNPEDEFSMSQIGPNNEIIGKYEKIVNNNTLLNLPIYEEPIFIEKMLPDGYMILNGHHRWAATINYNAKKVRVQVVNVTHEEDIKRMLVSSDSNKRVTLDLDDIVFAAEGEDTEPMRFPYTKIFDYRMKLGMAAFMEALKVRNYDIWVFTAENHSADYFDKFFSIHGIKVTGIVNCMNKKKGAQKRNKESLQQAFANKYDFSMTLLKDSIVYTDSRKKTYEIIDYEFAGASKELLDKIDEIEKTYGVTER